MTSDTTTKESTETTHDQTSVVVAPELARAISGATKAASTDMARPILCATEVSVKNGVLRTLQTDSYRMSFTLAHIGPHVDVGPFYVDAKALGAACKVKASTQAVELSISEQALAVTPNLNEPTVSIPRLREFGTYPDWANLLKAFPWLRDGLETYTIPDIGKAANYAWSGDFQDAGGVNPDYLADIASCMSPLARDRDYPVRQIPNSNRLAPDVWCWNYHTDKGGKNGAEVFGAYLLMPVRV